VPAVGWVIANHVSPGDAYDRGSASGCLLQGTDRRPDEFEPFQIVLRAGSESVDDVDVAISDLHGPRDAVISNRNATIYFEEMVDVRKPSNVEGSPGEWPDPLVPRVDRYFGERRNAFPFKLSENRNQPIWIELYIPDDARPGNYTGDVFVEVQGRRQISIPVNLEVWNFGLPSTSSLPNTYGFSGLAAVRQHYGKYTRDDQMLQLTALYQKAALLHRISIHGGSMAPPHLSNIDGRLGINWEQYDTEVGPFLNGTAIPTGAPLAGAKATTIDLRTSGDANTDQLKILYWREFAKHFKEKGWFDRLFSYVWDEPRPSDSAAVLHKAKLIHTAEPDIRNLVTAPLNREWSGAIDIWSPLINCFEERIGFHPFCEPAVGFSGYQEELRKGRDLWWYQSCASHGCNSIGGAYFTGWPSAAIDTSPVANRIMEWMSWKYGIHGELYYSMTEAYTNSGDVWKDVYRYGGNGDGTLFYPGTPSRVGGKTHIPIDSIRLKLIREGLEDYEYLHMLGNSPIAREAVDGIVHKTFDFEHDPAMLYAARRRMGEELNRLGGVSRQ
jgi:hypothetical protein